MKIAVLGAGAMGSIYGGHLSANNDVYMIDKKAALKTASILYYIMLNTFSTD